MRALVRNLRLLAISGLCLLPGCVGTAMTAGCAATIVMWPLSWKSARSWDLRVRYVQGGEEHVIKDTLTCKYDRATCNDRGWQAHWKSSLASKRDRVEIMRPDERTVIYWRLPGCEHLMNDAAGAADTFEVERQRLNAKAGETVTFRHNLGARIPLMDAGGPDFHSDYDGDAYGIDSTSIVGSYTEIDD